jgi:uncharacterized membrane protein
MRSLMNQLSRWPLTTWASLQLALVTLPTWFRAHGFGYSNFDFGIYSQALAHLSTNAPNPWLSGRQIHVFNDHFDPILIFPAFFTRFLPAAEVGLLTEGLCAGLSLVPLAWLAREERLSQSAVWLCGALLTFHLGVTRALGFPFHPTTWAMAPMAWLMASLILERWRIAWVALVLLMACKEEFPFVGLALSVYVFLRAPRRWAWAFLATSVSWGFAALILRPRLLGDVMPYATQPFQGWSQDVGAFLMQRLTAPTLTDIGNLVVAFIPPWAYVLTRRQYPTHLTWLMAALAPMLAIRFLARAWGDHYGAVVVSALVFSLAALLGQQRIPQWVIALTILVLGLTNESLLRRDVRALLGTQRWASSAGCTDSPERQTAVAAAVSTMRSAPGPLLVSGNLVPWLAERSDVYAFGGPQPLGLVPRSVLLERPPCGDTWGMPLAAREALFARWLTEPGVQVNDAHVLMLLR